MRIGIDFDNTIVTYDRVFLDAARNRGLVDHRFAGSKQAIRDHVRMLPAGELCWQQLQGYVYGIGMSAAVMFDGVGTFLRRCRGEGALVAIVSHKTEYGHFDPLRVNLRDAALDWMHTQGFFGDDGYGISRENVFFESTRSEKLSRIASLRCTHFIDDLEEVLDDPQFPSQVTRILLSQAGRAVGSAPYLVCSSWSAIEACVFDDRA
jgi:hypothetical protein